MAERKGDSLATKFRNSLLAGLVVVLPACVTGAVLWWLFSVVVAKITDRVMKPLIIFFVEKVAPGQVPALESSGSVFWFVVSGLVLVGFIMALGVVARNFIGRRAIRMGEGILGRIPLIRSVYSTVRQVSDALLGGKDSAFNRVVLIEYPRKGLYTLGLVGGAGRGEIQRKTGETVLNIFVPTTPNPTSGFLLMVPEKETVALDMTVTEAFQMLISAGAASPVDHGGKKSGGK